MQDLDECSLESGNLETVLDTADESDRVDLRADVLEQASDESCDVTDEDMRREADENMGLLGLDSEYLSKSSHRSSSCCSFANSIAYRKRRYQRDVFPIEKQHARDAHPLASQ